MRYEVLGGIEVVGEDESVLSLGGPTQHRLLGALLVEANHTVSVDHLVEALFDGAAVENSVKAVRTYVSRLRSVVGEGTVATTAGGYRLAVDSGLRRCRALRRARARSERRARSRRRGSGRRPLRRSPEPVAGTTVLALLG